MCRPRRAALVLALYSPYVDVPAFFLPNEYITSQKKTQHPQELCLTSISLQSDENSIKESWSHQIANLSPENSMLFSKWTLWTYVVFSIGCCRSHSSVYCSPSRGGVTRPVVEELDSICLHRVMTKRLMDANKPPQGLLAMENIAMVSLTKHGLSTYEGHIYISCPKQQSQGLCWFLWSV